MIEKIRKVIRDVLLNNILTLREVNCACILLIGYRDNLFRLKEIEVNQDNRYFAYYCW